MAKCFICGCELDENTKPEHIIPNGIGGKLKSKEILCDKHNNELFELHQTIRNFYQCPVVDTPKVKLRTIMKSEGLYRATKN